MGALPNRQTNVDNILAIAQPRLELHPFGIEVIQSLDQIVLPCRVRNETGNSLCAGTVRFNFAKALDFFLDDDLNWLERESGLWLNPFAERDLLVYLATKDGEIMLLDKHWLGYQVLPSLECAIENCVGSLERYDGIHTTLED